MSHSTLPFLLLSTRPEPEAASAEFESFRRLMGLAEGKLIQLRVNQDPLPEINFADYSALVIGGGPFNATDVEKSANQQRVEAELGGLMRRAIDQDYPVFATCYGIGLVALAVNAPLSRTYGETPSCITVTVTDAGRNDPLLSGLPEAFSALVGHVEAADAVPEGGVLLVRGDNCPVQMYRLKDNIYVTQFHPELEPKSFAQRLRIYKNNGYYEPSKYQRIADEAFAADLTVGNSLLRNFKERFQRPVMS